MKTKISLLILLIISQLSVSFGQTILGNRVLNQFNTSGQDYPHSYVLYDVDKDGDKDLVGMDYDFSSSKQFLGVMYFDNHKFDNKFTDVSTLFTSGSELVSMSLGKDLVASLDEESIVFYNEDEKSIVRTQYSSNEYSASVIITGGDDFTYDYNSNTYNAVNNIWTGDINGSGRNDILINSYKNGLFWYNQAADGSFSKVALHESTTVNIADAVIVDVDSDNDMDIVAVATDESIYVFVNDGSNNFTKNQIITFTTTGYIGQSLSKNGLVVSDLNNDTYMDIAFAVSRAETYVWIVNPVNQSYTQTTINSTNSTGLCINDVNKDGKPDLLTAEYSGYKIDAFLNDGAGNFTTETYFKVPSVGNTIGAMTMDDFDQDGEMDFVISKNGYGYYYGSSYSLETATTKARVSVPFINNGTDNITATITVADGGEVDVNLYSRSTATISNDNTAEVTIVGTAEQVYAAIEYLYFTGSTRGINELVIEINNNGEVTTETIYVNFTSSSLPKASVSVTQWPTVSAITYGQSLSSSSLNGGNADVEGTFSFSDETITPDAGSYSAEIIFTADDANNYETSTSAISVTVGKKELTVINAEAINKVQDGTTIAAIAGAELSDVIDGDDVELDTEVQGFILGSFTQSTVGANIAVLTNMTISGADATNYSIVQPLGLKANISLIAGDADVDGTITYPEIAGDINGDGSILFPEIAGDINGDGDIDRPEEFAGDTNGDGEITDPEKSGDMNGDGIILIPEIDGDHNGNGILDGDEVTTSTAITKANDAIEVYGNKGSIVIKTNASVQGEVTVTLYNLSGQSVYSDVISLQDGINQIDLSVLSKALYVVSLKGINLSISQKVLLK